MRMILHIGTHKTGTTSIQKFCARNRQRLRTGGLWYPDYDLIGREGHYAHHHLANAIAGLPTSRGGLEEAAAFFDAVRRQAGHGETVLISAEALWRHVTPPVALADNEFAAAGSEDSYWDRRRNFVKRVAEFAGSDDVEVVAVLRRQDDCAESMFKERIKGTSFADSFDRYLEGFSHRFRYFDQLAVWADFFPSVRALVYDDLTGAPNLVAAFFEALHVPLEGDFEPASKLNVSMSNDLIAFKRELNRSGRGEDELYAIAEILMDKEFCGGLELDQGSTLWPSPECRSNYLADFESQNANVLKRFSDLKRDRLFPGLSEPKRRVYAGLDNGTARAISTRLDRFLASRSM